jgi:hypothetical protein
MLQDGLHFLLFILTDKMYLLMIVIIALIIASLVAAMAYVWIVLSHQTQTSTPDFVEDKAIIRQVLLASPEFFNGLSGVDLAARGVPPDTVTNGKEYREFICQQVATFTDGEKKRLLRLCQAVNQRTRQQCPCIYRIPWRLCKVSSKVEGGYPHTFGNIIFLSDSFFRESSDDTHRMKTLLHEQVHVFQRMYPGQVKELYTNQWGLGDTIKLQELRDSGLWIRSNPDIDDLAYAVAPDTFLVQIYTRRPPTSLADSKPFVVTRSNGGRQRSWNVKPATEAATATAVRAEAKLPNSIHQIEHPNEIMASILPDLVFAPNKCPMTSPWCSSTKSFFRNFNGKN